GMFSAFFLGFAFGWGGLGAAVLGLFPAHPFFFLFYKFCVFLPFLGILTIFFPDNQHKACFYGGKRSVLTACTS
ncbi:MFS transporter, partial [Salmonella enterica subsp. enterica serovar Derby]